MSKSKIIATILFSLAGLCLLAFLFFSLSTGGAYVARGAVPNDNGWFALATSILSAGGFSLVGVVTLLIQRFLPGAPTIKTGDVSEIVELSASFLALMRDRSNRAAQRRFFFSLVDCADIMPGVTTSHENGVVTLSYSGFAERWNTNGGP